MEFNLETLLWSIVTLNAIFVALYNTLPIFIVISSLIILVLSTVTIIGILIDKKLHNKFESTLANRINVSLLLLFLSLINATTCLLTIIKKEVGFYFFTGNEFDAYIISTIIVLLTFLLYVKKFKAQLLYKYLENTISLIFHPHKIPHDENNLEIIITNKSFMNLNLIIQIFPNNLRIVGRRVFKGKNTPYNVNIKKKKSVGQMFHIKKHERTKVVILYDGCPIQERIITIF